METEDMKPDSIDFKGGAIERWSLDDLNPELELSDQVSFLTEDMALITYGDKVLLDVGWFGDGADGEFRVSVIEGENWEQPAFRAVAPDLAALKGSIEQAAEAASARRG